MECPDPFKDKVKCDKCKCWIDKNDAQIIDCRYSLSMYFGPFEKAYLYFCQTDKRPYDRMSVSSIPFSYYKEMEVDMEGNPIGYTKNKPNAIHKK